MIHIRIVALLAELHNIMRDVVTDMSGAGAESAECGCAAARLLPAPEPDLLYDHHSSEEELEVYAPSEFFFLHEHYACRSQKLK